MSNHEANQKKDTLIVTFNGVDESLKYEPHAQVEALLKHALDAFGVHDNRHTMSLFTEAGVELPDHSSIEAAGVKPGDVLILRPSAVKGG